MAENVVAQDINIRCCFNRGPREELHLSVREVHGWVAGYGWIQLCEKLLEIFKMVVGCLNQGDVVANAFGIFDFSGGALDEASKVVEAYMDGDTGHSGNCSAKLGPIDVSTTEQ